MVARLNHNNTTMRALRPLALLLVVAVAGTSPAAAASALSTTGPVHNSKGKSGRQCASTFDGCLKCKAARDGGGTYTCTRCRPNSTYDDAKAACVCNSDAGYGTISKDVFDKWVAFNCKGKRCPKWSTVAGKCVKCSKYFGGVAVGGACGGFASLINDSTGLWIKNAVPDPNPGHPSSPSTLIIQAGGNGDEPFGPDWFYHGDESYVEHDGSALESYDVAGFVQFCSGGWVFPSSVSPPYAVGSLVGCKGEITTIKFWANNPTAVALPWIMVQNGEDDGDYVKKSLYENERWTVQIGIHNVEMYRTPDTRCIHYYHADCKQLHLTILN